MNSITPRKTHRPSGPRRPLLRYLASSSILCLLGIHSALHAENARPADSFVDSIGVNTHFGHSWYQTSTIKERLRDSGIRYIRDNGASDATMSELYSTYGGIKTLLVFDGGGTIASRVSSLGMPYMIGLQGRNEPDSGFSPITWQGMTDNPAQLDFRATRAYQYELYNTAKANTAAKLKPIVSPPTSWSKNTATLAPLPFDKISVHAYPDIGKNPGWWKLHMECVPDTAKMVASGQSPQSVWVTETGYPTAHPATTNYTGSITQAALGKYIPRILATNFNKNIERTFLYEFYDESNIYFNNEGHFGLIENATNNYARKPSYWAVKNLISLLKDPGAVFSPGALNYTLSGTTTNVKSILLQKQNREYYLLIWQEVISCNAGVAPTTPPSDITVTAANITVNFGVQATSVTKYTGLSGTSLPAGTNIGNDVSLITNLSVPDEIIVLKIVLPTTVNPGSGTLAPPSGADLVITKVWSTPANPAPGEATKLYATIKNRGTDATTATTSVTFRLDANGTPAFTIPALPLAAGASRDIETGSLTTLTAGFHTVRIDCDTTNTAPETNDLNNMSTLTVPVLADRFTSACDVINPDWTSSGNWAVESDSGSGRTYFKNATPSASGTLTHTIPATTTHWRLDFEYNWKFGAASHLLKVYADVLDDLGNGYRILVHQGDYINYLSPLQTDKQIELFKVTNYAPVGAALGTGAGYDENGGNIAEFNKVSFIYDRVTQSISVYIDLNADGDLEQVIAPVRDSVNPTLSFTKLVLGASDGQGATATPMFDNVCFSHGMTHLVPAPHFVDSFIDDLAQWAPATNWTVITTAGQKYVGNSVSGASGTMTHPFVAPLTNGWSLGFDYDFNYGGNPSGTNKYGFSGLKVKAAMLDSANNGYRIVVAQGDQASAAGNDKIIKIYKVTAGADGATPLAQGIGYNTPGWLALGKSAPEFKRVVMTYNRKMQTLSAFIDLNGDGVMEQVISPVQDTSFTSFTQLELGAACDATGATATPLFDNIKVGLIQ